MGQSANPIDATNSNQQLMVSHLKLNEKQSWLSSVRPERLYSMSQPIVWTNGGSDFIWKCMHTPTKYNAMTQILVHHFHFVKTAKFFFSFRVKFNSNRLRKLERLFVKKIFYFLCFMFFGGKKSLDCLLIISLNS